MANGYLKTHRTATVAVASASALLVLLTIVTPSGALPKDPPGAHLRYRGDRIQRAHLAGSCWPGENGGYLCSDERPRTWPQSDRVSAGARLRLRIHWKREPSRIFVDSYRSIRNNGMPRGKGKDIHAGKRPVRRDGRVVAWNIVFRLHDRRLHYVRVLIQSPHTVAWNLKVRVGGRI